MMHKTRTLTISSIFPVMADTVWTLLTRVETLRYIAFPYAVFSSADSGDADAEKAAWQEGETLRFKLRIFGFFPVGVHTIFLETMNLGTYTVVSREHDNLVPVWNHTITIEPRGDDSCVYTDTVEFDAGFLTGVVSLWGAAFYRHRQKRWIKLLCSC
jgi:hypothetical protein